MGDPELIGPRHVPQGGRALSVSCAPFQIERHESRSSRTYAECEAFDLFTGELVYRGFGHFSTVYNDFGDPFSAVALAFDALPRASSGQGREMAELPMRPRIGQSVDETPPPPASSRRRTEPPVDQVESTGTAFFVSLDGHLISNHHVVEGCRRIRVFIENEYHAVGVIAADADLDVALLAWGGSPGHAATFRGGRFVRAGDAVVAIGYPLRGLLAEEATVTTGTVSAMAGIGNDRRFLQISAPVQAGNSGGPLLDESGRIVGVVVAKLDAARVFEITGDLPQNVNFAINGQLLTDFLNANGVNYATSAQSAILTPADVADGAKRYTVPIECTT